MQLTQNEYLFLYLFAVICVVASFIAIRKKPRDPVKLRLQTPNKKPVPRNPGQANRANTQSRPEYSRKEKALNAFFEFQGKRYDAFEVLNLPAGASIKAAQSAFNAQFIGAEGANRALLKAALEAIRTR